MAGSYGRPGIRRGLLFAAALALGGPPALARLSIPAGGREVEIDVARADVEEWVRPFTEALGQEVAIFSQAMFGENTGIRFATLMRVLCEKNGEAFVVLNDLTP